MTLVQISSRASNRLKNYPSGWFAICFSDDLNPGQILERKFMGQDLIVFRTASGQACVSDAFCPHMGAHFAYGGKVQGETIQCPFHGFCFDTQGTCVKTGYNTKPPRKARLRTWRVNEMNGVVLVHHHRDWEAPTWDVPALDTEGWTPLVHHTWEITANPYDTAENSVDIGHLSVVHGYRNVEMLEPLSTEGPLLRAKYAMDRDAGAFGRRNDIRAHFEIVKWGLGYSAVEVHIADLGLCSRHFVFPTAIDRERLAMRIAISLKHVVSPGKINPLLTLMPRSWLHKMILFASMRAYKNDVRQDFEIWKNKITVNPPALAEGDGPIAPFRRWTRQFDPDTHPTKPNTSTAGGVEAAE